MQYPIAIELGDESTAYGIIVPDILGCYSASDDFTDIIDNAREAIIGHLKCMLEDGEKIPLPENTNKYRCNPDYQGMYWDTVDINLDDVYVSN